MIEALVDSSAANTDCTLDKGALRSWKAERVLINKGRK